MAHCTIAHHPSPQHRAQEFKHSAITDTFLDRLHQLLMRYRRKTLCDIGFDHPPPTLPGLINEHLQGVMHTPFRAKPKTARGEVGFKDWLKHNLESRLHNTVPNRRNRQRSLLTRARLINPHPTHRQRPICPFPQLSGQLIKKPVDAVLLFDLIQRDLVDARRAVIPTHRNPSTPQDVSTVDLVPQRMKPSPRVSLGRPVQRMLQGTNRIHNLRPRNGGTSQNGTHRAPPQQLYAPTKQRPFPHRRLCCPPGSTSTTTASDSPPNT